MRLSAIVYECWFNWVSRLFLSENFSKGDKGLLLLFFSLTRRMSVFIYIILFSLFFLWFVLSSPNLVVYSFPIYRNFSDLLIFFLLIFLSHSCFEEGLKLLYLFQSIFFLLACHFTPYFCCFFFFSFSFILLKIC